MAGSAVWEIKEQSEELAEGEVCEKAPESARAWDAARRSRRSAQERQRQDEPPITLTCTGNER